MFVMLYVTRHNSVCKAREEMIKAGYITYELFLPASPPAAFV